MTDTREAPLSSSKQHSGPHSEQPVENVPMTDTANISNSKDTNSAHLLKIKQRPEWLKPILEEDRPTTLEPDWSMHTPNPIKIPRKTSYFKRLVIGDHSSHGFAKGLGRRNSASLIWKAQHSR
ncbi:hypothetical protein Tco_0354278 [Tanacetum coccineum]